MKRQASGPQRGPDSPNFTGGAHFSGLKDDESGVFVDEHVMKFQATCIKAEVDTMELRLKREKDQAYDNSSAAAAATKGDGRDKCEVRSFEIVSTVFV